MRENPVKRRLAAGETVIGSWLSFSDALAAEAMASAGWDWLLVDMEHGPIPLGAADARKVVQDARFPPLGERSRGGIRTPLAFRTDAMTYFERANDEIVVLVQVETATAVRNVREILAVEGIDGVFLGPNDLAASIGKRWPDVWEHDDGYMAMVRTVADEARSAGKVAGFLARDAAMAKRVAELGFRFIGVSGDGNFVIGAAKRALDDTRAALK